MAVCRKDTFREREGGVGGVAGAVVAAFADDTFHGLAGTMVVQHLPIRLGSLAKKVRASTVYCPNGNGSFRKQNCRPDDLAPVLVDRPNVFALHRVTWTRQQRASKMAAEVAYGKSTSKPRKKQ